LAKKIGAEIYCEKNKQDPNLLNIVCQFVKQRPLNLLANKYLLKKLGASSFFVKKFKGPLKLAPLKKSKAFLAVNW